MKTFLVETQNNDCLETFFITKVLYYFKNHCNNIIGYTVIFSKI